MANRNINITRKVYDLAKGRCNNPNTSHFERWGGRGIEFRFSSFQEFVDELGKRPSRKYQIDRIDNDGHYEKGNVKWATAKEQQRNRSNNARLTIDGETKLIVEWAKEDRRVFGRIKLRLRRGWCPECAVKVPCIGPTEYGRAMRCEHIRQSRHNGAKVNVQMRAQKRRDAQRVHVAGIHSSSVPDNTETDPISVKLVKGKESK